MLCIYISRWGWGLDPTSHALSPLCWPPGGSHWVTTKHLSSQMVPPLLSPSYRVTGMYSALPLLTANCWRTAPSPAKLRGPRSSIHTCSSVRAPAPRGVCVRCRGALGIASVSRNGFRVPSATRTCGSRLRGASSLPSRCIAAAALRWWGRCRMRGRTNVLPVPAGAPTEAHRI